MTTQPHFIRPPSLAVWLLSLFALAEKGESILGDLLEEFSLLVCKSGVASARRWYWRQTIKTVPRLAGFGFRSAPWLTAAAVAGGFLLRKLVGPLVGSAIFAVLERFQVYEYHFSTYRFFASTGLEHRTSHHVPVDRLRRRLRDEGKRNGGHNNTGPHLRRDGCGWFRIHPKQDRGRRISVEAYMVLRRCLRGVDSWSDRPNA